MNALTDLQALQLFVTLHVLIGIVFAIVVYQLLVHLLPEEKAWNLKKGIFRICRNIPGYKLFLKFLRTHGEASGGHQPAID